MARILFLIGDAHEGNAARKVADEALARGHVVIVLAKGNSARSRHRSKDRGELLFEQISEGDDLRALLDHFMPDVAVIAIIGDCVYERAFADIAASMGISLVLLEVMWGAAGRLLRFPQAPLPIDALITCDKFGCDLGRKMFGEATTVIASGHWPVYQEPRISLPARYEVSRLRERFENVIVFSGNTATQLAAFREHLRATLGNWCLIPKLHPTRSRLLESSIDLPPEELKDFAKVIFEEFEEHVIWDTDGISTEAAIALSDVVCAGLSTTLNLAAWLGKVAAFIASGEDAAWYLREQYGAPGEGLSDAGIVGAGCAVSLWPRDGGRDLLSLKTPGPVERIRKIITPFDAAKAFQEAVAPLL
jgi:hypothetical protein